MNFPKLRRKRVGIAIAFALFVACASVPVGLGAGVSHAKKSGASYTAILLNPFMGNDWRPQMERYATVIAKKAPLVGRVKSLRIVTTQNNDPNQQNAALQSAILESPNILLIDAASETASNQLIQQACAKGIVVVTFDVQATAPCAWKLAPDWVAVGKSEADWAVRSMGGKGTIFVDRGTPGAASSNGINKGVDSVLKQHKGLKVVQYFSKFSPGDETSQVSQLLAAHRDVRAIISQAYAAQEALHKAGLKVPATGFNYPQAMKGCVTYNTSCDLIAVPPWISGDALKLAVDVLDKKVTQKAGFVPFLVPVLVNNSTVKPINTNLGTIYQLTSVYTSKTPAKAFIPVSPPWVHVAFNEIIH